MVNTAEYRKERDGITTNVLDDHGEQGTGLVLSQRCILQNTERSLPILQSGRSATIESNEQRQCTPTGSLSELLRRA
jgi:hypothetical protein